MGVRRTLIAGIAVVAALFACAQGFPGTTSSFTSSAANSGNTVTAAADWTAPTISSAILQKSEGGVINKFNPGDLFYLYANITDPGNPSAGLGTVTANTTNIATVTSATLTAGSYTVNGTAYNYRSAQLTAKSTLTTTTYTYSLSVSDLVPNGPTSTSPSVSSSIATFAPSSFLTTNVVTAGKALATDKFTMVYSSAPDPESVFAGWDGSSRSVSVALADGALYGFSSTTSDIIGITDATGAVTPLGYVMTGGNYVATSQTVTFTNSTIALSGSTFTVTLGTPSNSTYLLTDAASHVATWSQYPTVFDQFGNGSTAATITGTTHVQF